MLVESKYEGIWEWDMLLPISIDADKKRGEMK